MDRHDGAANTHIADQGARMERRGAAEGTQDEVTRIQAALDQDRTQRADHVGVDNAGDGKRRRFDRLTEGCRNLADRSACGRGIEFHAPAKEIVGVDAAEHEIGIGDCRFGPA